MLFACKIFQIDVVFAVVFEFLPVFFQNVEAIPANNFVCNGPIFWQILFFARPRLIRQPQNKTNRLHSWLKIPRKIRNCVAGNCGAVIHAEILSFKPILSKRFLRWHQTIADYTILLQFFKAFFDVIAAFLKTVMQFTLSRLTCPAYRNGTN